MAAVMISVVMPVYNAEEYLPGTLADILGQNLKDIEAICVNDCSTDGSVRVLQDYAEVDKRLRIVSTEKNSGAARARNLGLSLATGKYVIFVDADDAYAPGYLERLWKAAEKNEADVTVCRYLEMDAQTGQTRDVNWIKPTSEAREHLSGVFSIRSYPAFISMIGLLPFTKLCRREFLLREGLSFQDLPTCNDVSFGLLATATAKRLAYVDAELATYRTGQAGALSAGRSRHPLCLYLALRQTVLGLRERGLYDVVRRPLVSRFVETIDYELMCCDGRSRQRLRSFWQKRGLRGLGMEALAPEDFQADWFYRKWQKLALPREMLEIDTAGGLYVYGVGEHLHDVLRHYPGLVAMIGRIYDKNTAKASPVQGVSVERPQALAELPVGTQVIVSAIKYFTEIQQNIHALNPGVICVDIDDACDSLLAVGKL